MVQEMYAKSTKPIELSVITYYGQIGQLWKADRLEILKFVVALRIAILCTS